MDSFNYLKTNKKVKDSFKSHKIAAALYLVTNHLSDTDPLKQTLRTQAVTLSISLHEGESTAAARAIQSMLDMATIAGVISEKNASIISLELRHYLVQFGNEPDTISALFTPVLDQQFNKPTPRPFQAMSYTSSPLSMPRQTNGQVKSPVLNENKSKRQDAILSFINEKKSVGIKDISALFSDTSEKTIQRELGALVAAGRITKRGEKRWSIYVSVS